MLLSHYPFKRAHQAVLLLVVMLVHLTLCEVFQMLGLANTRHRAIFTARLSIISGKGRSLRTSWTGIYLRFAGTSRCSISHGLQLCNTDTCSPHGIFVVIRSVLHVIFDAIQAGACGFSAITVCGTIASNLTSMAVEFIRVVNDDQWASSWCRYPSVVGMPPPK